MRGAKLDWGINIALERRSGLSGGSSSLSLPTEQPVGLRGNGEKQREIYQRRNGGCFYRLSAFRPETHGRGICGVCNPITRFHRVGRGCPSPVVPCNYIDIRFEMLDNLNQALGFLGISISWHVFHSSPAELPTSDAPTLRRVACGVQLQSAKNRPNVKTFFVPDLLRKDSKK